MAKNKLFIANWKLYLRDAAAVELAGRYADAAAGGWEVAVAPPLTALERVSRKLAGSKVRLAAPDMYWIEAGAFTGAVSPLALSDLGAHYVILGHSERRKYFNETDEMVAKKAAAAAKNSLTPVICVGETKEEYDAGRREEVVGTQVKIALASYETSSEHPLVIAYEPVWAIGTGVPCPPEDAGRMHQGIRNVVAAVSGQGALHHVRVLYGGSVDASNVASYLDVPGVDGLLVGKASTDLDQSLAILSKFS